MKRNIGALILVVFGQIYFCKCRVEIANNEYTGVLIAIEPTVAEDPNIINSLISMMTDASVALLTATQQRAYFKEVTILVPKTWTSSYTAATTETYVSSDIRIAPQNPAWGDNPYAWTYYECGKGGEYIHLTPAYLTDDAVGVRFGPRGELVVHEWGHYRWGVFDEYPTDENKKFYLNSTGGVEATRCSGDLEGFLYDIADFNHICTMDPTTRLPTSTCYFIENSSQPSGLKTSMMYKQFLDQVTTFCHSNKSDPVNLHNSDAPNNQNARCNLRSTWDVIMENDDFQNGAVNAPNFLITDTTPVFKVLKAVTKRVVLVMDVSGSMRGPKLQSVASGTKHLILNVINDGTHVGLVSFSTSATLLQGLTELTTRTSRNNLATFIPIYANGGTGIGSGIQEGIKALESGGQSPDGGTLVVFTDGEENQLPYVASVTSEVMMKKVIVHTVFIGLTNVNQASSLKDLSDKTGGTWGIIADAFSTGTQLNKVLASLSQNVDGDLANELVQVSSQAVEVEANTKRQLSTAIDASVGNHTTFTFSWLSVEPKIEIKPPQENCVFSNSDNNLEWTKCAENDIHEVDAAFKSVIFTIPETAKVGSWEYSITSSTNDTVTVAVVSASSGEDPITVDVVLSSTSVDGSETTIVIAKVFQKFLPVLGASVTAKVVRPTGSDTKMLLFDNGSGADIKKNDGVYSRYFAEFNSPGRYYFEVFVTKDEENDDNAKISVPSGSLPINFTESIFNSEIPGAKIKGTLERVASGPGLEYTGSPPTEDIFPPNKVIDLSIAQANLDEASEGVVLTFTSPGDDYDHGQAFSYEIRYTIEDSSDLQNNFSSQTAVVNDMITNGDLNSPQQAMNAETFNVSLVNLPDDVDSVRVTFALKSFDEAGNSSPVSNIVATRFFIKSPPIPSPVATTTLAEETSTKVEETASPITSDETATIIEQEVTESVKKSPEFNRLIVYIVPSVLGVIILIVIAVVAVRYRRRKKIKKSVRKPEQIHSISRV